MPTSSGHRGKSVWSSTIACEKVKFLAARRALMKASSPAYSLPLTTGLSKTQVEAMVLTWVVGSDWVGLD